MAKPLSLLPDEPTKRTLGLETTQCLLDVVLIQQLFQSHLICQKVAHITTHEFRDASDDWDRRGHTTVSEPSAKRCLPRADQGSECMLTQSLLASPLLYFKTEAGEASAIDPLTLHAQERPRR